MRLVREINLARTVFAIGAFFAAGLASPAQTDPGPVNVSDRESARSWFNTWWPRSFGAPMGFTGNADTGVAGDTSQAYKDQTLLRLNIFRRWVGDQPLTLDAAATIKAQAAAVLCAANDAISHTPPSSWKFYNQTAADGCSGSELGADVGPTSVVGFIADGGPNNTIVGHRLSLLDPTLYAVGIGNSLPSSTATITGLGVEALYSNNLFDLSGGRQISTPLLLWPRGYVPFYLIPGRWVAGIPDDFTTAVLDFLQTTVAVTRNGQSLPVNNTHNSGGGAVIFTLDGTSEGRTNYITTIVNGERLPGLPVQNSDSIFHVTISNIKIRATGALWNGTGKYEYDVIGYNPDIGVVQPGQISDLVNISTRSFAGSDSSTQIAGFIINGSAPRKVLIRAGGPYLSQFGVEGVLADPVLTLYSGNTPIQTNDDWASDATNVTASTTKVGAVAFSIGSKDAAMVATLQPGGYTAKVTGKGTATGNAIVEVWDADDGSSSRLVNISTRSFVGTGSSIQIGGFILHGSGPRKVLIRAGGPYLTHYGVAGVLADPVLTIFKGQTQIAQNDDWGSNAAEITAASSNNGVVGFDAGSKDAAIVLTLDPDVPYTAKVNGKGESIGNALIEVFAIP